MTGSRKIGKTDPIEQEVPRGPVGLVRDCSHLRSDKQAPSRQQRRARAQGNPGGSALQKLRQARSIAETVAFTASGCPGMTPRPSGVTIEMSLSPPLRFRVSMARWTHHGPLRCAREDLDAGQAVETRPGLIYTRSQSICSTCSFASTRAPLAVMADDQHVPYFGSAKTSTQRAPSLRILARWPSTTTR